MYFLLFYDIFSSIPVPLFIASFDDVVDVSETRSYEISNNAVESGSVITDNRIQNPTVYRLMLRNGRVTMLNMSLNPQQIEYVKIASETILKTAMNLNLFVTGEHLGVQGLIRTFEKTKEEYRSVEYAIEIQEANIVGGFFNGLSSKSDTKNIVSKGTNIAKDIVNNIRDGVIKAF